MAVDHSPKTLSTAKYRHRIDAATGYLMLGMADHALRELNIFPEDTLPHVMRLRGEAYREQSRHDAALDKFESVLSMEPSDLTAVIGKAWCLKRLARLDDAIETLRDAATMHPREALIQYNLACYFALASDKARCLSHLGVALRLDARYAEMIDDEPDFDAIRDDGDFVHLVETVARVA